MTKTKEGYLASFGSYFKLWIILVIKSKSNKGEKIEFSKNEGVNKEIIESFLKNYDRESGSIKNVEKNNNIYITIKDIEIKEVVGKNYYVEFSIIIEDKIEIFFVNKYIEIKVRGEIYFEKEPKFYFYVKQYKLSLNKKLDKNNDDNKNNNAIENIELDEKDGCWIGMCPKYSINNKEFKEIYEKISGEQVYKDPQKEIRNCLDDLIFDMKYKNI